MTRLQWRALARLAAGEPMFGKPTTKTTTMFWRRAALRALYAEGFIADGEGGPDITPKGLAALAPPSPPAPKNVRRNAKIAAAYREYEPGALAERFGLNVYHVRKIAARMGVRRRAPAWTPQEDAILREHYPAHGADGVARQLPTPRSSESIGHRARLLEVRRLRAPRGMRSMWLNGPELPRFSYNSQNSGEMT